MRQPIFAAVLLLLLTPWSAALGYEGGTRAEVDGGVHQPVLTQAPRLLEFVQAEYPALAQQQGLFGAVTLLVTLDETGRVSEATVTGPLGHGFDEAATEAVRRFRFSPAEVDGVPAPIQLEYVYHFQLAPPPVPEDAPTVQPRATLLGQLIARGSRNRISGAILACGDAADAPQAVSDSEGRFSLEVPAGECAVRVVVDGFQKFQTTEPLAESETREVVYYLIPSAIGYETVVRGNREKKEVVRRTLGRQELQRVPGTFGDPVRVLQNLPGVARAPFISGALIVRGASPDQTRTLFDGVEIPLLYHLGGGPSVVNAEFLDRVDFYPGGFGARYGRAVGGVVDVATRRGATDTWHGSLKADFLDSGFFVEAPLAPGISAAAAARRSYIDGILPFVLPNDPVGGTLLILPAYWDYQARLDFGPRTVDPGRPRSTYYVMAFGSDDTLKVVASGGGRNRDLTVNTRTLFHRVKGDWTYRQGNLTSVFAPYAGYDLADLEFGAASLRTDAYSVGGREDLTLELLPALTVRTGFDLLFSHLVGSATLPVLGGVQYVSFPGDDPQVESQDIRRVVNSFDGAGFLEADLKLGPVTLTPGVRGSYSRIYGQDRQAWDPRLWVRWQPLESTAIKGSVGLYTQPPSAFEMEQPPLGNPNLVHEKAFQASLGFDHRFTENISVDITGFFNRRYDLVSGKDVPRIKENQRLPLPSSNTGLGRAYGLEVLLRHDVTRNFFGWLAYTLNRSEERIAGEPEDYVLTTYDQTHIVTAVASYRLPHGFEVGARFRYVTGRPLTPTLHPYDQYDVDGNRFRGVTGPARSTRYADFQQLDLRFDKAFLFQNWTLGVYLDIQNLYNATNTESLIFDYRFREAVPVPGIPFLPVVGVKGSF